MRVLLRLATLTTGVLAFALATAARAEEPAATAATAATAASATTAGSWEPCDFVHALSDVLDEAERDEVSKVCKGARPGERFHGLFLRTLTRGGLRSAAFATLLKARGAGELSSEPSRPRAFLQQVREAVGDPAKSERREPRCKALRARAQAYADAIDKGVTPTIPFRSDDAAWGTGCSGVDPRGSALLTIPVGDLTDVFVAAATSSTWSLASFAAEDFIRVGRHEFIVVPVPVGALVTVSRTPRGMLPTVEQFVAEGDRLFSAAGVDAPPSCYDLTIDTPPAGVVLLDGERIEPHAGGRLTRVVQVPRGDHELVVMNPDPRARWVMSYRETLAAEQMSESQHLCREIKVDTTRPDAIAVLDVSAGSTCERSPVGADDVAARVTRHLEEALNRGGGSEGPRFTNLQSLARYSHSLADLKARLDTNALDPGQVRRRADALASIEALATAAWRQGVGTLLAVDLRCTARGQAWSYALTTYTIPLERLRNRVDDRIRGPRVADLFEIGSTSEIQPADLDDEIEMAVDRALGIPYVRFLGGNVETELRVQKPLALASFLPNASGLGRAREGAPAEAAREDHQVVVTAVRLAADKASARSFADVCRRIGSRTERDAALAKIHGLAADQTITVAEVKGGLLAPATSPPERPRFEWRGSRLREVSLLAIDGASAEDVHRGFARRWRVGRESESPGLFVVVAKVVRGSETYDADARCIGATVSNEQWVELGSAGLVGRRREHDALHLQLMVGHTWYRVPKLTLGRQCASAVGPRLCRFPPALGLLVAGGYGFTRSYATGAPPGWQDLDTPVAAESAYQWDRHAALASVGLEVRVRVRRLPGDFYGRLTPLVSAGWTQNRSVPIGLQDFRAESQFEGKGSKFDVDVGVLADIGWIFVIRRFSLLSALRVGSLSVWEGVTERHTVLDDRGLFVGGLLRFGGGTWDGSSGRW